MIHEVPRTFSAATSSQAAGSSAARPADPPKSAGFPAAAGSFATAVGATVLAGWVLDIETLKGAGHSITMKSNAAIGLIACGLSLRITARRLASPVALACAALAGLLGTITIVEHIAGWDLGVDQLLFREAPGASATASPGRMGPNASLSLTLASAALLLLNRGTRNAVIRAQVLALAMATLATIAIVGYVYGAQELYAVARYTGIAWPTALTLLVLGLGILVARRDVGPASVLVSPGPGGVIARRLLLPAVVVPLILGYVRLLGQRANLYDTGFGAAMFAVALIGGFVALIWRTALSLDVHDRARETAQRERDELLVREQAAREQAERASRLKDEFLARLSHELRTPLNAILGWADMLRSNVVAPDRRAYAAELVARNGALLARLVEDLLELSRLATGRLQLNVQPVDLRTIANQAIETIGGAARDKGITVVGPVSHAPAPATVDGDPERLHQVVGNLLSNAVRFTPRGGRIVVTIDTAGADVELIVADTGQGIGADFLPHVFERFRQEGGATTRAHAGLGIGLAIVRELTELHGGSVRVASDGPTRGSTFVVSLPRAGARRPGGHEALTADPR